VTPLLLQARVWARAHYGLVVAQDGLVDWDEEDEVAE